MRVRLNPGCDLSDGVQPPATQIRLIREANHMSPDSIEEPFDSIESAQDFMNVLALTILDAMKDLHYQQELAVREGQERRSQALELAMYKAKTLSCYVHKSRRTLNDLRMLKRLILNERSTVESLIGTM